MGDKVLTVDDIITASGKYPDRAKHPELTKEVRDNIEQLSSDVNEFLDELGWTGPRRASSGFRPSSVNAATQGAAKKSAHMRGLAVDLEDDDDQTLAKKIREDAEGTDSALLRKYGLWLEDPDSTKNNTAWAHLDKKERRDRPVRVFKV